MDKYKETFQTWNKIASIYQDKFMNLDLYNDTYDIFSELITERNPTILEIGCGPGNITKYLLDKRADFKITVIDIAPNMIELAKKNNPTADFKVLDSRNIDKLKIEYDGIIAGFCIPYLSKVDLLQPKNLRFSSRTNLIKTRGEHPEFEHKSQKEGIIESLPSKLKEV